MIEGPVETGEELDDGDAPATSVLHGAARATALLSAAGIAGQVFTLARELYVAAQVGASIDLDALLVAAVFPLMFASLLASGTSWAIVPAYAEAEHDGGRREADRLLGASLTWTVILGTLLALMVIAGASMFVAIAGPGLDDAAQSLATRYVPLLAPMLVFSAAAGLLTAMFQIHDWMRPVAIAWLAGPLASVVVTVALWDTFDLTALALAMTAQQAITVMVLVAFGIWNGMMPPITLRADREKASLFIRHAIPLTISSSVLQLNLLTDRAIASLLAPGAVSALRYAEGVIRIPLNAVGPAWSAAIYPALVRASLLPESRSLGQAASSAMRYVTAIFVPLSVATMALAPLIVEVAYVRGAFDEEAWTLTTAGLAGFAPLLFLTMANSVLTGAHNARRRGVFLMSMGILNAILNAFFDVGLGLTLGIAGVALSTSLTVGLIQFLKAWRLGQLDEAFPLADMLLVSARSLGASLCVAIPVAIVAWTLPYGLGLSVALALLVALATAGMIGYIAVARLIGMDEPWIVARTLIMSPLRLRRGLR